MSHHANTYLRLLLDSRELPRHLRGTLEHREDLSFGIDEQVLHNYALLARHRGNVTAASRLDAVLPATTMIRTRVPTPPVPRRIVRVDGQLQRELEQPKEAWSEVSAPSWQAIPR
jgi:hypothetical protein